MLPANNAGTAMLIRADARTLPVADCSVDLIVTSPPYFALRSYQDGGEHYDGQIGAEATSGEFIDALIAATREMVRVLKPSGSIFVNLGDKYAGSTGSSGSPSQLQGGTSFRDGQQVPRVPRTTVRPKSLIGVPWRYALRCIDELGLILRAEIIWAKPNGLPESVTDRVSRKHEQWFHFTVSERYYSNIDAIREERSSYSGFVGHAKVDGAQRCDDGRRHIPTATLGKVPGSHWNIPTEPLRVDPALGVDHFAAFPTEWPRRLIIGWSPSGICTSCGEGRRALVQRHTTGHDNNKKAAELGRHLVGNSALDLSERNKLRAINPDRIIGEQCGCDSPTAPTRPAVVLDPFGGTGTTAAVAKALGRHGISVDLSNDYLRLADWRCNGAGYDKVCKKIRKHAHAHQRRIAPQLTMEFQ